MSLSRYSECGKPAIYAQSAYSPQLSRDPEGTLFDPWGWFLVARLLGSENCDFVRGSMACPEQLLKCSSCLTRLEMCHPLPLTFWVWAKYFAKWTRKMFVTGEDHGLPGWRLLPPILKSFCSGVDCFCKGFRFPSYWWRGGCQGLI